MWHIDPARQLTIHDRWSSQWIFVSTTHLATPTETFQSSDRRYRDPDRYFPGSRYRNTGFLGLRYKYRAGINTGKNTVIPIPARRSIPNTGPDTDKFEPFFRYYFFMRVSRVLRMKARFFKRVSRVLRMKGFTKI